MAAERKAAKQKRKRAETGKGHYSTLQHVTAIPVWPSPSCGSYHNVPTQMVAATPSTNVDHGLRALASPVERWDI